jgi:predicted AAA+ superfamily ATPase
MHPLVAEEMGADFDLNRALRFGLLPSIAGHAAPHEYLKSYVQTYLREEIQQEGLTRNLGNFARFLETASFFQGSPVNVAEIARESALDRKVVDSYFGILDDLMVGLRLPVFAKRARRRLVAHPKFYFFDAGVYRTIRPMGPLDSPEEADGASLETLCLQELRALNDMLGLEYEVFFWRTSDGAEVDFVLYGPRGLLAFEVKRSSRYSRSDLTGLRALKADYPIAQCYLFYGGEHPRVEDDIQILPLQQGFSRLAQILSGDRGGSPQPPAAEPPSERTRLLPG